MNRSFEKVFLWFLVYIVTPVAFVCAMPFFLMALVCFFAIDFVDGLILKIRSRTK